MGVKEERETGELGGIEGGFLFGDFETVVAISFLLFPLENTFVRLLHELGCLTLVESLVSEPI